MKFCTKEASTFVALNIMIKIIQNKVKFTYPKHGLIPKINEN